MVVKFQRERDKQSNLSLTVTVVMANLSTVFFLKQIDKATAIPAQSECFASVLLVVHNARYVDFFCT